MKKELSTHMINSVLFLLFAVSVPQLTVRSGGLNGWVVEDGNYYWYENGVKQGTEGRGKEIYDPESDAWYWLDAVDGGKKAVSKDVYQESDAGIWAENEDGTGKWVRYDENGHMVKGWDTNESGTYYFDLMYGTMAKGNVMIDGGLHTFDVVTGISTGCDWSTVNGWVAVEDSEFWYENGVRQGEEGRGKEVYDPASGAWYWLDAVDGGKKAVSKDVYQESAAGVWAENEDGTGKWVRYDQLGRMVKGWDTNENGAYYFHPVYGTMAKGKVTVGGKNYEFDSVTGTLIGEKGNGYSEADGSIIYSGKDGNISWKLTENGKLIVTGTCGEEQAEGWKNAGWSQYLKNITSVYIDISHATNLYYLFGDMEHLTEIENLENLDTSRVTNMSYMFYNCYDLENLDLSAFDTSNVTDMRGMFSTWTSYQYSWYVPHSKLKSIDLSSFDTSNVTDMSMMFSECYSLEDLDLSGFDTGKVKNMREMFNLCTALKSLDLSNFNTGNVIDMGSMFCRCGVEKLNISGFKTERITDMSSMFNGCVNLTDLNVSSFDTSNVVDMNNMFYECESLESLDLSNFDTSKVTDMSNMFAIDSRFNPDIKRESNLKNLNLSSFDTGNVADMHSMFEGCIQLKSLDLSNFDTGNVIDMSRMFWDCEDLINLELSSFDTSNVTDMSRMFSFCNSLESLDLRSFDTKKVENVQDMFFNCSKLTSIIVGKNWVISDECETIDMFNQCGTDHVTQED